MAPTETAIDFRHAAPFWASLVVIPLVVLSASYGGWALLLPIAGTWWAFSALDRVLGRNTDNPDPMATDAHLYWYSLITWIWLPIQVVTLYTMIAWVPRAEHLALWEKFGVFFGVGVMSGSIGIVYAHELMHQKDRFERWLADLLLASVLYSHFRTEHLLVHHPWVGTRRDAVSARYNEGFHRYFFRVLREGPVSAWRAERAMLARRDLSPWDGANPFWRYWALQGAALILALVIGGWLLASRCSCSRPTSRSGNWSSRITWSTTGWCANTWATGSTSRCARTIRGTPTTRRRTGSSSISSATRTTITSRRAASRCSRHMTKRRRPSFPTAIR
jgi:alkane 1-monooxygenase